MNIPQLISAELNLPIKNVAAALQLMAEGATIPFISRYRKEVTGSLNEVQLLEISQHANTLNELAKRKETVIETIGRAGQLTPQLREKIEQAMTMSQLEDLYLPFKPKRNTRASMARERGLEPLAKMLMSRNFNSDPEVTARRFVKGDVSDPQEALAGARDIIAEWVNEDRQARNTIRSLFERSATISSKVAKTHADDITYIDYHDYNGSLKRCPSHRYLAMKRAENEGIVRVSIDVDLNQATERLDRLFLNNISPQARRTVSDAINDSFKRLLKPSIENEIAAQTKKAADKEAIDVFADNLRQLLMAPPLGHKAIMGIDPGFRTGCKIVCIDRQGKLLHHDVIYPTAPRNDTDGAARIVRNLVERFDVEAIAVGNGTASRETELFLKSLGEHLPTVYIVSEAGASVYSASEMARNEFPDQDVTVRGAVSIARRLADPLAELVKIDPKSIGVGQYQHDVDQNDLKEALDHTVMSCVNSVGINLNTASPQLLAYVSGIGPKLADAIVKYRHDNGPFKSRKELLNVPRLGDKVFTLAAGFLRIPDADFPLDNTAVHPERYKLVERMAADLKKTLPELLQNPDIVKAIDLTRYVDDTVGLPTLKDIVEELQRPGRDPRGDMKNIQFDDTIHDITDLYPGMTLPGIVNNITAFGAFVDLGIHHSGLIHLSKLSDRYITHPSQVVSIGQHVTVNVIDVDLQRNRIALSLNSTPK